jgi:hypothetical protein
MTAAYRNHRANFSSGFNRPMDLERRRWGKQARF